MTSTEPRKRPASDSSSDISVFGHPRRERSAQKLRPQRPTVSVDGGRAALVLSTIQTFFDERIVQWAEEERPCDQRSSARRHGQLVPEQRRILCAVDDGEGVAAIEPPWAGELEFDPSARLIPGHEVAHRSMSSSYTDAQRPIQTHGWPFVTWPQAIVPACERIDEPSHFSGRGSDLTLVPVVDHVATVHRIHADYTA